MKEQTRHNMKMIFVLLAVCLVSAAALGFIYGISAGRIEENEKMRIEEAVYKVIPGIDGYEKISSEPLIFRGISEGEVKGYAAHASGIGFQGEISLMAGMDAELEEITGVSILKTVETPGLGDRIREKDFLSQFRGMNIPEEKNLEVEAITGATMSSDAVKRIVKDALDNVKKRIR